MTEDQNGDSFILSSRLAKYQMGILWIPATGAVWGLVVNLILPESAVDPVLVPTLIALVGWGLWRAARIALRFDSRGYEARNFFRSYAGLWDEVDEITAVVAHGPFGSSLGFVRKHHDGLLGSSSVSPQAGLRGGGREEKQRCFDRLEKIAEHADISFMLKLDGDGFDSLPRGPWAERQVDESS